MANSIPYRIRSIKTLQYAIFPEKYVNDKEFGVNIAVHFDVRSDYCDIRNKLKLDFYQKDTLFLTTEIQTNFAIEQSAAKQLKEDKRIPVGFLRYMATISVGTARGIIHARTEGTALCELVLPPVNLTNIINEDLVLND